MSQGARVFVSHDHADAEFAQRLAEDLRRQGARVWIAPESVRPGEGWVEAVNRGLEESDHMVIVLTADAVDSAWVRKEAEVAVALERKGRLRLIPLEVGPCEPPPLWGSYQSVSFRGEYEKGLGDLTAVLGLEPGAPAGETAWAAPPRDGRHCPACGRDVGVVSVVKALTPRTFTCPHCGTRVGYPVGYGALAGLLALALPLVALGAYALELGRLGAFGLVVLAALGAELAWVAYLRNRRPLRVVRYPR